MLSNFDVDNDNDNDNDNDVWTNWPSSCRTYFQMEFNQSEVNSYIKSWMKYILEALIANDPALV